MSAFINGFACGFVGGVVGIVVFLAGWRRLELRSQARRKAEWDKMVHREWERLK